MIERRRNTILKCLAFALACAALGAKLFPQNQTPPQQAALVWPSPPAPPSIRFVDSFPGAELPERRSLLRRLGKAVAPTSRESLVRPLGLAAANGMVYVTDPGSRALFIFDLQQKSFQKVTKVGSGVLEKPVGVAVGKEQVFVSDSALKCIFAFDRRGHFLRVFADKQLERPTGLAVDQSSGRLYVADTAAQRVLVYDKEGKLEKSIGRRGTSPGEFNYPTNLWLDREGSLFVVDSLNYRLQIFHPDGTVATAFGHQGDTSGDFASPKGVATDAHGHIFVVDALFDTVQIFDRRGRLLLNFGERGAGPGQFWLPSGLFIDDNNRIYVADSYNQRIQVFEFLGAPENAD